MPEMDREEEGEKQKHQLKQSMHKWRETELALLKGMEATLHPLIAGAYLPTND